MITVVDITFKYRPKTASPPTYVSTTAHITGSQVSTDVMVSQGKTSHIHSEHSQIASVGYECGNLFSRNLLEKNVAEKPVLFLFLILRQMQYQKPEKVNFHNLPSMIFKSQLKNELQ